VRPDDRPDRRRADNDDKVDHDDGGDDNDG
jgi:hypothetical protein